jgi:hypothetical protein
MACLLKLQTPFLPSPIQYAPDVVAGVKALPAEPTTEGADEVVFDPRMLRQWEREANLIVTVRRRLQRRAPVSFPSPLLLQSSLDIPIALPPISAPIVSWKSQ